MLLSRVVVQQNRSELCGPCEHNVQASFTILIGKCMTELRFLSDSSPKLCRQLQTPLPKYSNVGRCCNTPCGAGEDC